MVVTMWSMVVRGDDDVDGGDEGGGGCGSVWLPEISPEDDGGARKYKWRNVCAADHVVAPTPGSVITIPKTGNEFAIKGNHLNLVKGNQFDGRTKTDPLKHINEFLRICDIFKYRDTKNEAVRLMMFPLSLTGEAKTWLDELNKGTIETRDELRTAFISRFFPPALFDRLLGEIQAFSQHENKSLTDAWLRMKEMLQNCHGHNLSKGIIIKIFYHGLSEITHEVLNAAADGIFLYKTPNQAYQLLEDKVMAISIILVSSDSSKDSVGTPAGQVILFSTIPTTIRDTTLSMTSPTTHTDTTPIPIVAPTIPPSPDYTPASPDYSPVSDTEFELTLRIYSDITDTPPSHTHGTPLTETTLFTQRSPTSSGTL
ncbi:reverse transcriptase domain-containing protein [Tanacetum coccineum]